MLLSETSWHIAQEQVLGSTSNLSLYNIPMWLDYSEAA